MAKSQIVAGIELGSSSITTLIAQVVQDPVSFDTTVNIVGVSSVETRGVKKGQIVDLDEAVETTIASVEGAERMAGYNLDCAYISVGGAHVTSQNSHGVVAVSHPDSEITQKDMDRVIESASAVSLPSSRELIHVLPKEYIVDGESGVKVPLGMSGIRLEVDTHLVTASAASLKNIRRVISDVGVDIEGFVFSGLAAAESVLTKTERELGCAVVDIGGGTTSVAVFTEGALCYSGVIPIGSKNVTNDLAIGLRVSLESAEQIKRLLSKDADRNKSKSVAEETAIDLAKYGVEKKNVSPKTLVEGIIRPRLNEIFTMVRLRLEKEKLNARIPSGVIVTGGGAEVVGVVSSAKRMLSLSARVGIPKGVGGLIDDVLNPSYAVPIGLIHYGIKNDIQEGPSVVERIKLPSGGIAGKLIDSIRDLLP